MDYRNSFESFREVGLDLKEGADLIMVKPGIIYLDIINNIKKVWCSCDSLSSFW